MLNAGRMLIQTACTKAKWLDLLESMPLYTQAAVFDSVPLSLCQNALTE